VFKEMAEHGWLPTETARLTWPQVQMILGDGKQAGRRLSRAEVRAMGLIR
jgi:hypothetical protein